MINEVVLEGIVVTTQKYANDLLFRLPLLAYSLAEQKVHQALPEMDVKIPNHLGKPTQRQRSTGFSTCLRAWIICSSDKMSGL
jgi:transposase